jgi:hypothetical protein
VSAETYEHCSIVSHLYKSAENSSSCSTGDLFHEENRARNKVARSAPNPEKYEKTGLKMKRVCKIVALLASCPGREISQHRAI